MNPIEGSPLRLPAITTLVPVSTIPEKLEPTPVVREVDPTKKTVEAVNPPVNTIFDPAPVEIAPLSKVESQNTRYKKTEWNGKITHAAWNTK